MKVLITGVSGQLGQTFMRRAVALQWEIVGCDRNACDVTNVPQVREVFGRVSPHVVINCAAYTAVDKAETDRAACAAINADGAGNVAKVAHEHGIRVVHVSTDYVFDGLSQVPYTEDSATNPLSEYGRSKLAGEYQVLSHNSDALVLRTSWLYGETGHNFIRAIIKRARDLGALKVVVDQRGVPTSCETLVDGIVALLGTSERGIFHMTNSGECSWFDFAHEILRLMGWGHIPILPIETSVLNLPAPRPAYSVLSNSRYRTLGLPPAPDWKDSLAELLPRLLECRSR
jgi:dTDP-4-dehydrorhamnose reductase